MIGLLLAALLPVVAQPITITFDGRPLATSANPIEQSGRVLVPMRDIFEALSAELQWDPASRTVRAFHGSTEIVLTIGSTVAYVAGRAVNLSVPAQIIGGFTYVPLRFVAEATGANVKWIESTRTVQITTGAGEGIPPAGSSHGAIPPPVIVSPRPNETVGPAVDVVGRTVPGSAIRIVTYVHMRDTGRLVAPVPGILRNVPANGEFSHRIALPTNKYYAPQAVYYDIHAWTVIGGQQSKPTVVRVYRR